MRRIRDLFALLHHRAKTARRLPAITFLGIVFWNWLTVLRKTRLELAESRRTETLLRQSEQNARHFQEALKALHEVSIELSKAETMDDLCLRAVELGRSKLGFDRLGIWFMDQDPDYKLGTFGTDEQGRIRDERQQRIKFNLDFVPPIDVRVDTQLFVNQDSKLYNQSGEAVGHGWNAVVFLQNAGKLLGYISADNYLHQEPLTPYTTELLSLFGAVFGHLCTRKKTEEALRQSEERLRTIVSNMPVVLFDLNREGSFTFAEGQTGQLLHRTPEAIIGSHISAVFGDAPHVCEAVQRAMSGETARVTYDLGQSAFEILYTPYKDADSHTMRVIGLAVDIAERRRMVDRERAIMKGLTAVVEAADELIRIQDLTTFYRRAVELGRERLGLERSGIFVLDPTGQFFRGTFGTNERGETTDEHLHMFPAAEHPEFFNIQEKSWLIREKPLTYWDHGQIVPAGRGWEASTVIRIDKAPMGIFFNDTAMSGAPLDPVQQESLAVYCSLLGNIIERKQAETALRESEEKFRTIFEASPTSILISKPTGEIVACNPITLDLLGRPLTEVLGRNPVELGMLAQPEAFRRIVETLHRSGTLNRTELEIRDAHGKKLQTLFSARHIMLQGDQHVLVVASDITPLKKAEAEIRALNTTLEQRVAQRTAELAMVNHELEAFAYSISHDLRAPLRSIDGFSRIVAELYQGQVDAIGQDYLNRIRSSTQRMGDMIDALLTLSRLTRSELRMQTVDMSIMAQEILDALAQNEPARRIEVNIAPNLTVQGDHRLLRVMLENLLGNAWKYTSRTENASITFRSERRQDAQVFLVRDNGTGFDMAFAEKLFGAFQRFHDERDFPGTGIGLATVQRIVHRHGGKIWAESEIGRGTTFYFQLHALDQQDIL